MTIHSLWKDASARHAQLPAVSWVGETPWTYAELDARVKNLSSRWSSQGLKAGDRVALWSGNHPGWGVVYLAATTSARVIVPILPDFSTADVLNVVGHSGARVLVLGAAQVEAWKAGVAALPPEKKESLSSLVVELLDDLLELPATGGSAETLPQPEDLAALIYTSGTTGASKGVMLTQGNVAGNAAAASSIPGYVPGDKQLSVLPLAHTYECTLGFLIPLREGVHISYLNKPAAPAVLMPALALVRPHAMLTVPLFMEKIYRAKVEPSLNHGLLGLLSHVPGLGGLLVKVAGKKLYETFGGRLKFFGIGGAPLAPEVEKFLFRAGFPYAVGYGLTETSPLVAGHLGGRLYSTGRILPGVEVKIQEPLNHEGAGEILVKGPNVMRGYYHDDARTAEVLSDGWFRTGDLGSFDTHGHLHIRGRIKNVILGPSGENIYPEAIEAVLNRQEGVLESLVLQRGLELVALVVFEKSHNLEALKAHVNQHLARYSRLSRLEVQVEPFDKTATLKIKRYLYS
ncbi:MAG: AMP-binding protein [Spirochaetales bacterium]